MQNREIGNWHFPPFLFLIYDFFRQVVFFLMEREEGKKEETTLTLNVSIIYSIKRHNNCLPFFI